MSVYVDACKWYPTAAIKPGARRHGNLWSHLWADSAEELDEVAKAIGLHPSWLQNGRFPHYDVTRAKRSQAMATGQVTEREFQDWIRDRRQAEVVDPPTPSACR